MHSWIEASKLIVITADCRCTLITAGLEHTVAQYRAKQCHQSTIIVTEP